MAEAQEILHGLNAAVRAALVAHQGEEVKDTGDGIFAAFGSAVAAVQAALQIQRDLAERRGLRPHRPRCRGAVWRQNLWDHIIRIAAEVAP